MTSILAKVNPIWSKNQCLTNSIYSPLEPRFTNTVNQATELVSNDNTVKAGFNNNGDFGVGSNNDGTVNQFNPTFTVDKNGDTTVHDLTVNGTASINGVASTTELNAVENKVNKNTTDITNLNNNINAINDSYLSKTEASNTYLPINFPTSIGTTKVKPTANSQEYGGTFKIYNGSNYSYEFQTYTTSATNQLTLNGLYHDSYVYRIMAFGGAKTTSEQSNNYVFLYTNLNIQPGKSIHFDRQFNGKEYDDDYNYPKNNYISGIINTVNKDNTKFTDIQDNIVPSFGLTEQLYALKTDIPTVKVPLMYTTSKSYNELNPANPESYMTINSDIVSPIMLKTDGMNGNLIACDLTTPFQQIKDYATINNLNIKYMTIHLDGECSFRRSDTTIVGPKNDNFRLYCYLDDVIESPSDNKTANCVIPVEYCPGYFNGNWEKYFYKSPISCTIYNSNSNILTRSNYYILFGFTNYNGTTNIINYLSMYFNTYLTGYFEDK